MYSKGEVIKLIAKYWADEMSEQGKSVGFSSWIKENL